MDVEMNETETEIDLAPLTDEPEIGNDQLRHSHSRIRVFEKCAWKYKGAYIDRRKGSVNALMLIGRVGHDAIGNYNLHCVKNKITHDYENRNKFVDEALIQENIPAEFHEQCYDLMKTYAESHEIDLDAVIGCEEKIAINRKFEQVDWMADDVFFRCILDFAQATGTVCKITDYKTGYAMNLDYWQLKIYAWVLKKLYPHLQTFQLEYDFVRFDYQTDITITAEELVACEKELLSRIAHIEKETKFAPNVGIQCADCELWYCCPAMKATDHTIKVPTSRAEAEALALKYETNNKLATEARKVLKVYCDQTGTFDASGRRFEFKAKKTYEFEDMNKLYLAMNEVDVDLFGMINIDNRKLTPMLKDERIMKVVKTVGTPKVAVNFSTAKIPAKKKSRKTGK